MENNKEIKNRKSKTKLRIVIIQCDLFVKGNKVIAKGYYCWSF